MSVREIKVSVLQERGCRQHDVGVVCGVGGEHLRDRQRGRRLHRAARIPKQIAALHRRGGRPEPFVKTCDLGGECFAGQLKQNAFVNGSGHVAIQFTREEQVLGAGC